MTLLRFAIFILVFTFYSARSQNEIKELDLSRLHFQVFPNDTLLQFEHLEILKLRGVGMDSIGEITCCRNLKSLDLSNNSLNSLEGLSSLQCIEQINLSSNKLEALPIENPFNNSIRVLKLNTNKLEILPDYLFELSNLERIELRGKQLYNYDRYSLKGLFGDRVKVLKSPNCKCD